MLTLGIPNGSLFNSTIDLLNKIGIGLKTNGRNFISDLHGGSIFKQAITMRPQDIPEAILDGMLSVGICGRDCVAEAGLDKKLSEITELNYSKKTRKPVKIVIFGQNSDKMIDEKNVLVTSEYPNLTKKFFKKAKIRFSHGSTEQKVAYGKYRFGVGIIETGDSLRDNGLVVLKTIMVSPTALIARKSNPEIKYFGALLRGGLAGEKYRLVKMNVAVEKKQTVLAALSSLRSPTINSLADGSFSLETIIKKETLAGLVVKLSQLGATDIIIQDVKVVL